ncbi:energy transducer TonB [Novosphingobium colocasiae]|uniref:energy transducer TonB n=1 Tax=Novosphingobium colocasiae TaxID=1256513 RepID=UPI0035AE155E
MSYIDHEADGRGRQVVTGGIVALLQAGVAIAVISGLSVVIVNPPVAPPHMPSLTFTTPVPKPPPSPPVATDDRPVINPDVVHPIDNPLPPVGSGVVIDDTPAGGLATDPPIGFVRPDPPIAEPTPRFAAKAAMVRNNPAGWATTADYPTRELRDGHQGPVRFELAIDAGGRVSRCTVTASSGWADLDRATCDLVSRRARFTPAMDTAGNQAAGTYSGTIRWVIPQD